MLIASVFEVASIGSVIPLLTIIINPEILKNSLNLHGIGSITNLQDKDLRLLVVAFFCISIIAAGTIRIILIRLTSRFSLEICSDICSEIFLKTISQPYVIQISRNSGDIIHAILSQTNSLIYEIILPILTIISSAIMGLIILMAVLMYSPSLALFIFPSFAFLYLGMGYFVRKKLHINSEILNHESNNLVRSVQESLGGIRDILLDNSQEIYWKNFQKSNVILRRTQAKISFISNSPRYAIEAIGMMMIALTALRFQNSDDQNAALILPTLGALALAAQRLLPIFQQSFASWVAMRSGLSSLNSVLDYLSQPSMPRINNRHKLSFNKSIGFKNIAFVYTEKSNLILKNVNIEIQKGERVGIVGKTGSGKSTLLDILMGLLPPTEGEFIIDGAVLDAKERAEWQANISHVPQVIYMSDATIAENIAFGTPQYLINRKLVMQCAELAQLSDVIEALPNKYETMVGERGVRLSGGQRQRIGIARALYKQSEVIILDEATSSLDAETEKKVMEAIYNLNPFLTVIMVSHRVSTLASCTNLYKLESGVITPVNIADIL